MITRLLISVYVSGIILVFLLLKVFSDNEEQGHAWKINAIDFLVSLFWPIIFVIITVMLIGISLYDSFDAVNKGIDDILNEF